MRSGTGLAYEAGQTIVGQAFATFGLHRIEANILPGNERSIALATRLGFELEGLSKRYLQIDGRWADHLHYVHLADGPVYVAADEPRLASERLLVRPIEWADCDAMTDYQQRNRDHLAAFSPQHVDYSPAGWRHQFCELMLAAQTRPFA